MLLKDLNLGPRQCMFPSLAVCVSLECKASQRELTSRLLSDLIAKQVLNEGDMMTAFNHTLAQLPELILDTPEAPQVTPTLMHLPLLFPCRDRARILYKGMCTYYTIGLWGIL